MSRRKPAGLLGPDGKPLDKAKYAPETEPEPKPASQTADDVVMDAYYKSLADRYLTPASLMDLYGGLGLTTRRLSVGADPATPKASLAERVANDLVALGIDTTDTVPELPRPDPDLTTYADALEHAIKTCPHKDVTSTMYARGEYQCQDCRKYLSADDMRKRSSGMGFLGGFGW